MAPSRTIALASILALSMTACTGETQAPSESAGGGLVPPATSSTATSSRESAASATRDSTRAETFKILSALGSLRGIGQHGDDADTVSPNGQCRHGIEVFVPDRFGDSHSYEREVFYDPGCRRLARDTVRVNASTGSNSETVAATSKSYSPRGVLVSTRTTNSTILNATLDANGFPELHDGFVRASANVLSTPAQGTVQLSDDEIVVSPGISASFCTDSAGYNAVGSATLNETFGWQSGIASGTFVTNADGSLTWSGTLDSTVSSAAIGGLSIAAGAPNTICPITVPAFTLTGGIATGGKSSTLSLTERHGVLVRASIGQTTAAGDFNLTASTNKDVWYVNPGYISGTITDGGKTVATFSVNAFGDGTLTRSNGTSFAVIDWSVIV